jgi:hypothetical protein
MKIKNQADGRINPSYLGGGERKMRSLRAAREKVLR